MSHPTSRRARFGLLALWPAGLLLALAAESLPAVTTPVFALLAACYVAAAVVAIRHLAVAGDGPAALAAAAAIGLFAVAGGTGAPTAAEPGAMALNTAVLFAVALVLLVAACGLAVRLRSAPGRTVPAIVVFALGTGGFLLNLLARAAILLTGAAGEQLAVEPTHWSAESYLRGLPGPPGFVGYTLVWLDLVQLAYVCSAFAAAAALGAAASSAGVLPRRTGLVLTAIPGALAVALLLATVAAWVLPHTADAVPAAVAFALSIPFMATLAPFLLGAALLGAADRSPITEEYR